MTDYMAQKMDDQIESSQIAYADMIKEYPILLAERDALERMVQEQALQALADEGQARGEREAFEAWALSVGARKSTLFHDRWDWAWRAWQARAALAAPAVPIERLQVKVSGIGTPDVDVEVQHGKYVTYDHGPNLAEALARLAARVARNERLPAPTLAAPATQAAPQAQPSDDCGHALTSLVAYLREEADFNRSWTDGRRGDLVPGEEYAKRRLELAQRADDWADAVERLSHYGSAPQASEDARPVASAEPAGTVRWLNARPTVGWNGRPPEEGTEVYTTPQPAAQAAPAVPEDIARDAARYRQARTMRFVIDNSRIAPHRPDKFDALIDASMPALTIQGADRG